MQPFPRTIFNDDHDQFRSAFRSWATNEVVPHHEQWEQEGIIPRHLWTDAGKLGFLGITAPEKWGGGGSDDYRFAVIMSEETGYSGAIGSLNGFTLHNDIVLPYICELANDEQAERWIPKMVTGEYVGAIAMTEPNTGSDLSGVRTTAVRKGGAYVVNGAKTFISNGIHSDLVITVVKTDPDKGHRGMSLLVLERGMKGFERGRNLDKMGLHAQDTAELSFSDVEVPRENLLGEEGMGFIYLMQNLAQERLGIAVLAVAVCEQALTWTLDYTRERKAFGQSISQFQHSKFLLAELATETQAARTYVDRCIEMHLEGKLTPEQAAAAKFYTTELQNKVCDRCVQLHGGYGYMREYNVARAWADARIQTIYGGTTEIMKEIVGRSLAAG